MKFNERLKSIRKELKYTQKQVATGLGITERNYQDWEYGRNKPGFDSLIALANFLNVSLDYLLGRSNCPDVVLLDESGKPYIVIESMSPNE